MEYEDDIDVLLESSNNQESSVSMFLLHAQKMVNKYPVAPGKDSGVKRSLHECVLYLVLAAST